MCLPSCIHQLYNSLQKTRRGNYIKVLKNNMYYIQVLQATSSPLLQCTLAYLVHTFLRVDDNVQYNAFPPPWPHMSFLVCGSHVCVHVCTHVFVCVFTLLRSLILKDSVVCKIQIPANWILLANTVSHMEISPASLLSTEILLIQQRCDQSYSILRSFPQEFYGDV